MALTKIYCCIFIILLLFTPPPHSSSAFDTDGSLKALPQLEEGRSIDDATGKAGAATSLPVHAAGDLLFVFLPTDVTGESWP
mmetsp:Transcript_17175/g.31035  ORF Transcript_17175/g.31035 Transcript_17175/m.31035 type:complete len:82 (+) Transcript_17175:549-794(+)